MLFRWTAFLQSLLSTIAEREFALFLEEEYRGAEVQSSFTSVKAPRFGVHHPDIYIPKFKHTFEFNGCLEHFHTPSEGCTNPKTAMFEGAPDNTTNFRNVTKGYVKAKDWRKASSLTIEHGIEKQTIMWECRWEQLKNVDPSTLRHNKGQQRWAKRVQRFMKKHYDKRRPPHRLFAREAVRGGKTETYEFLWQRNIRRSTKLYYDDYNSLYPSIAVKGKFPCGPLECLIRKVDIARLHFDPPGEQGVTDRGQAYLRDAETGETSVKIEGLIQCKILPPREALFPFLMTRVMQGGGGVSGDKIVQEDAVVVTEEEKERAKEKEKMKRMPKTEKAVSTLCSKCAETGSKKACKHSDEERALVGTWCLNEIAFAIRKCGYKLLSTYEVYAYKERKKLFKSFLEPLAKYKIQYSGYPSYCETDEQKLTFVTDINNTMGWEEGSELFLRPQDIVRSPAMVAQYKLMMNGTWINLKATYRLSSLINLFFCSLPRQVFPRQHPKDVQRDRQQSAGAERALLADRLRSH